MKKNIFKTILSIVFILSIFTAALSQPRVEITPYAGYLLGGSVKFYEGKFKIENTASYGGMLAVQARGGNFVELSYLRMDSEGRWKPYDNYYTSLPTDTFSIAMNYLQINSLNEFPWIMKRSGHMALQGLARHGFIQRKALPMMNGCFHSMQHLA